MGSRTAQPCLRVITELRQFPAVAGRDLLPGEWSRASLGRWRGGRIAQTVWRCPDCGHRWSAPGYHPRELPIDCGACGFPGPLRLVPGSP